MPPSTPDLPLTSPGAATSLRARMEEEADSAFLGALTSFLQATLGAAKDALDGDGPVLAAGIPGMTQRGDYDPFAFTNVRKNWYATVRDLAERRADLVSDEIEQVLLDSTLPADVYEDVAEVLTTSRTEQLTTLQTKRRLSAMLIPKERPGTKADSRDHRNYKNRVRRIARTAATTNLARSTLRQMADEGYTHKRWVAHHDGRTRPTHLAVDGAAVPLDAEFRVGAHALAFPGDPSAPAAETYQCRCVLVAATAPHEPETPAALVAGALPTAPTLGTLEGMSTSTSADVTGLTTYAAEPVCAPCEEYAGDPDQTPAPDLDDAQETARWSGVIGVEGEMTGDGRLIEHESLQWDLPLPLRYVPADVGAHDGAQVVGRIHAVERTDDGKLWGTGDFDLGSEVGREAHRQVNEELTNGISMDLDNVAFEVRVASEVGEMAEDGTIVLQQEDLEREPDDEGRVTVQSVQPDDEVRVTTSGRLRAATIVSIPAFASAMIHGAPNSDADDPDPDTADGDELSAALVSAFEDESDDATFNWVDDVGGLPQYIDRIRKHLQKKGMAEGHAIASAVNAVKKMCRTGDLNWPGKQDVNPGSRAEACAAVASWEAKKKRANADSAETDGFREVSDEERKDLAEKGHAMPDGSYPIANESDLKNAIQAIGRAKDPEKVKAHIRKRAKALGAEDLLPEDWAALTAAAPARIDAYRPSLDMFSDPGLPPGSGVRIDDETGRVTAHLAEWGMCHTSHTAPGKCVQPPSSATGYAYFRTGAVLTSGGDEVPVGRITLGTGHADEMASPAEAMRHYDDTGSVVAFVTAGEDANGIWISGALAPGVTEREKALLRGSALSGDWRRIGTNLELVAALAVNVAGFPIPRQKGMVASGQMTSLVASGVVTPPEEDTLGDDDMRYLLKVARERRAQDTLRARQMHTRVRASTLAASLHTTTFNRED